MIYTHHLRYNFVYFAGGAFMFGSNGDSSEGAILSSKLTESFSLFGVVMSILNLILVVTVVAVCIRRRRPDIQPNKFFIPNALSGCNPKNFTNYASVRSKLSVSSIGSIEEPVDAESDAYGSEIQLRLWCVVYITVKHLLCRKISHFDYFIWMCLIWYIHIIYKCNYDYDIDMAIIMDKLIHSHKSMIPCIISPISATWCWYDHSNLRSRSLSYIGYIL